MSSNPNPNPGPSPSPTPTRLEAVYVETLEVLLAADPAVGHEVEEAPQLRVLVRHRRPRQPEARLAAGEVERLEGGEVRLALGVLERVHLRRRRAISPLHLPYISRISPVCLPYWGS